MLIQHWSKSVHPYASLSVQKSTFDSPDTRTLAGASQTYLGFAFGSRFQIGQDPSPKLSFGAELGYHQRPVVGATSATELKINRIPIPEVGASLRYLPYQDGPFGIVAELEGGVLLPGRSGDVRTRMGNFYGAKLSLTDQWSERSAIEIGPFYQARALKTSDHRQTERELGMELRIKWAFGNETAE